MWCYCFCGTITSTKDNNRRKDFVLQKKIFFRQSNIEDMQIDETENKNFKRLDDQQIEDIELQDDKKNNFKIKYDELLKSIQEHNFFV